MLWRCKIFLEHVGANESLSAGLASLSLTSNVHLPHHASTQPCVVQACLLASFSLHQHHHQPKRPWVYVYVTAQTPFGMCVTVVNRPDAAVMSASAYTLLPVTCLCCLAECFVRRSAGCFHALLVGKLAQMQKCHHLCFGVYFNINWRLRRDAAMRRWESGVAWLDVRR